MATEYGNKLNPYRKLRKPLGVKGIRRSVSNTHVPDTIDQNSILTVRFPSLGKDDVIVPKTARLVFKIELNSTDVNRTIVNNLGRAIVSKIEVKLDGQSVFTLNDSDIYFCYTDLWKTSTERENAAFQGIQSEAIRKIRINAGDKDETNVENKAVADTYSNLFYVPLDFELLTSHMPFFQSELKDRLSYEITFNSYNKVVIANGDADANYAISNIHLEFEAVTDPDLATTLKNQLKGRTTVLYDRVIRHNKKILDKSDTVWNINLAPKAKSMKGVLMLFIDPADGGAAFDRDSEKFYNPKINKVSTTIDGNPNQLFSSGMQRHQQFDEIRKYFSDGQLRSESEGVSKELELADVKLADYATSKFALWLDMRSTDDNTLHGSGRKIEGASQSILIEIEKDAEAAGNLDCYVYYIQDAQLNFNEGRLGSTVY